MDIDFRKRKLEKLFNAEAELIRQYGEKTAEKIMSRMAVLHHAPSLGDVPIKKPERCHPLKGKRKGEYAVDLDHPRRLVFEPNVDPVPETENGEVDLKAITAITIISVEDYH